MLPDRCQSVKKPGSSKAKDPALASRAGSESERTLHKRSVRQAKLRTRPVEILSEQYDLQQAQLLKDSCAADC